MQTRTQFVSAIALLVISVVCASALPPRSAQGPGKPHLPSQDPVSDPKMFPQPDLVILQITKGTGARAHIKNQGKGNAGSCTLAVMCYVATLQGGSGIQSGAEWQVPALKAGGDAWISLGKCNPTGGTIDADNAVKESNEGNNTYKVKG